MKHRVVPFAALAGLSFTALGAAPALAAGQGTVSSPTCGTVRLANTTSHTVALALDGGGYVEAAPGRTSTLKVPGGSETWIAANVDAVTGGGTATYDKGVLTVTPCPGRASRSADGDEDGDGRADLLAVQSGTGDLYSYRSTATGLAPGVKVGSGWNHMVFMQRVHESTGAGTANWLLAVRDDGTLWRYVDQGRGHFTTPARVGTGFTGYTNFAFTATTDVLSFGAHALVASKAGTTHSWMLTPTGLVTGPGTGTSWDGTRAAMALRDGDGDGFGELLRIQQDGSMLVEDPSTDSEQPSVRTIGSGWGAMQVVASPGSLDGDRLSDLVARRSDGNLYSYTNTGGRWGAAVRIGQHWDGIRLLA